VGAGISKLAELRRLASDRPSSLHQEEAETHVEDGAIVQKGVVFPSDEMVRRALDSADPEPTMLSPERQLGQVQELDNLRNPLEDPSP
jgi:hypothetical protein